MSNHPACESCGLYRGCKNPFSSSDGSLSPRIIFIGDAPDTSEDMSGIVFNSQGWKILKTTLGKNVDIAHYVNLVRCAPYSNSSATPTSRMPTLSEISSCRVFFNKMMKMFSNQAVLMPLGKVVYQSLTGDTDSFSEKVGKKLEFTVNGITYPMVPNFHPDSIAFNPRIMADFQKVVNSVINTSEAPATSEKWKICSFEESMSQLTRTIDLYKRGDIEYTVFDTETTSLFPWGGEEIMFSIANEVDSAGYSIPLVVNNNFLVPNTVAMLGLTPPSKMESDLNRIYDTLNNLKAADKRAKENKKLKNLGNYDKEAHEAIKDEILKNKTLLAVAYAAIDDYLSNKVAEFSEEYKVKFDITNQQKVKIKMLMREVLETVPVVGHNIKFDLKFACVNNGLNLSKVRVKDDTIIMGHQCYGRAGYGLGLKDLTKNLLSLDEDWKDTIKDYLRVFKLTSERSYDKIPTAILGKYAGLDAYYSRELYKHLRTVMSEEMLGVKSIITDAVIPFTEAETKGIAVDAKMLKFLDSKYSTTISAMFSEMKTLPAVSKFIKKDFDKLVEANAKKRKPLTDEEIEAECFNPNSHDQMRELIYGSEYYNLPVLEEFKTDTGAPQTSADLLDHMVKNGYAQGEAAEFIKRLQTHKTISKLYSSYIKNMPEQMADGLYKPEVNLTGTVSGRSSSSFHTLPSVSDLKRIFISRWRSDGGLFLAADQSQIELRVGFSLANEEIMIQAFKRGLDLHTVTASTIYSIPVDEVSDKQRKAGKIINFSIFYGKTAVGLAHDLGMSVEEAQEILNNFFGGLPNLVAYMQQQREISRQTGFVVSPTGRVIQVAEVFSSDRALRSYADRVIINLPIQGSASDLVVDSSNNIYRKMKNENRKSVFLGQVHDSLEYDIYPGELFSMVSDIKFFSEDYLGEKYVWMKCPLRMDFSIGTSWGSAVDMKILPESFTSGKGVLYLEGECLERDYIDLINVASRGYSVDSVVAESTKVDDSKFDVDIFIRDSAKVKFNITIGPK